LRSGEMDGWKKKWRDIQKFEERGMKHEMDGWKKKWREVQVLFGTPTRGLKPKIS
jgi:hypothetical protein